MAPQKFEIVLDNPYAAYFPGAVVAGSLLVWLTKPRSFRKIAVSLKGKANVRWSETRQTGPDRAGPGRTGPSDNRRTETVYYTSCNSYLDLKQIVHGSGGDQTYELPAGNHVYRFEMVLPSDRLPSSFEGKYGSVRYFVKAKIDRPWRSDDETKTMFTLNSIVDLNFHPENLHPMEKSDHKRVCCFCCRSGRITAVASVARTGYVPGEYVEFSATVDNKSNNTVRVKMQLIENIIYRAQGRRKIESRTLLAACEKIIEPENIKVWDHEGLVLPPMPPTGLPHCDIIDVDHTLEFEVNPGMCSIDLELPFKIKIGTIPYSQRFEMYERPTAPLSPFVDPLGPVVPSAPGFCAPDNPPSYNSVLGGGGFAAPFVSTFPAYPNMPPPSYKECAFGTDDFRDENDTNIPPGHIGFVPRYASYQLEKSKTDQ